MNQINDEKDFWYATNRSAFTEAAFKMISYMLIVYKPMCYDKVQVVFSHSHRGIDASNSLINTQNEKTPKINRINDFPKFFQNQEVMALFIL